MVDRNVNEAINKSVHHVDLCLGSASLQGRLLELLQHRCYATGKSKVSIDHACSPVLHHLQLPDVVLCKRIPYDTSILCDGMNKGLVRKLLCFF